MVTKSWIKKMKVLFVSQLDLDNPKKMKLKNKFKKYY